MATGTLGTQARQFDWQATHYLRKKINFNDGNIGSADKVKVGVLPKGAFILGAHVEIVTGFNAGNTNVLTVGTNPGSDNNIVAAGDVAAGAAGVTLVTRGFGRAIANAADVAVYALYTQSGTAASAGQAIIVIQYAPDNDQ